MEEPSPQLLPPSEGSNLFQVALRFRAAAVMVLLAVAYGTAGYVAVEGWSVFDAFYMTVITLSTVGYLELHELGTAGRVFTVSLIGFGVAAVFALVGVLAQVLVSGELGDSLKRGRMRKRIDDLSSHHVICAYGRVGRAAADELRRRDEQFVVVDLKEDLGPLMEYDDVPYILGDPTREDVLRRAGIERATGLICAVDSDATNVYITLTARAINPKLFIVARASNPQSVDTLERAGADRVVSPYTLSGARMAAHSMSPALVDFLEMVAIAPDLRLEEVLVRDGSAAAGQTVGKLRREHPDVSLLAVKRSQGALVAYPPDDLMVRPGDLVVALGPIVALSALE